MSESPISKRTARRIGYSVAIAVNVALLVIVNNVLDWGWFSWLTQDLENVLPVINLSLIVAIVANAAYIGHDGPGFKGLLELVVNTISLVATIRLLRVFPFDFSTDGWGTLTRGVLIVAIVGISIGLVVQLARLARLAARAGETSG
jgi:hypothetical protein